MRCRQRWRRRIGDGGREAIPITTIPLPTRDDPEVQLSAVKVPAQVREGEPFYVEVVIDSNHDDEGLIEVFRGAHKVLSETKPLKKGRTGFVFRSRFSESGSPNTPRESAG